MQTTVTK